MADGLHPVDPSILGRVQQHLQGLKKTADGALLYNLIERGLHKFGGSDGIEHSFTRFLHSILHKYIHSATADPATRFKARLIQQRLSLRFAQQVPGPAPRAPALALVPHSDAPASDAVTSASLLAPEPTPPSPAAAGLVTVERDFTGQVLKSITRNEEFTHLLTANRDALARVGASPDTDDVQEMLIRGLEQLIAGHQELGANLRHTTSFLKAMRTDRTRLEGELRQAQENSVVDGLTGMASMAAFMRQLEAEMGRAKRYRSSLSVALIDIDALELVNGRYGRDAGDRVLSSYAALMSRFRTSDVAARQREDQFAVLLPSTGADGALCAVEKLRKQALLGSVNIGGRSVGLPTFSCVIVAATPNEEAAALLARAEAALLKVKERGPNQIAKAPSLARPN